MSRGFIYILTHPRMPGIVKIGYTEATLEERIGAINSATGVPGNFHIAYAREVENPFELERQIHSRMSAFRYIGGKPTAQIGKVLGVLGVLGFNVALQPRNRRRNTDPRIDTACGEKEITN